MIASKKKLCLHSASLNSYELLLGKGTFLYVGLTKTQISLFIRAVWSESSMSTWRNLASWAIQNVPSEGSDQTDRIDNGCISPKVL